MKDIKVIVLDIDGTLFNDEQKISPKTKEALVKAQNEGCIIVLASGRPTSGLWYISDELEMNNHHGLLCSFNGSRVVDTLTTDILFNAPMSVEDGVAVLEHMEKFDVNPMIYKDTYLYTHDAYAYKVKYESDLARLMVCEVSDMKYFLNWQPNKILTSGDPAYLRAHCEEMAAPFKDRLNMMFTADFYFEFTAKGIDKAKALDVALNKLGYCADNCIAFGDAQNDLPIIRYAKVGVAMGNAMEEVKAEADEITLSNNEDGIVPMLEKYIFNA
ncbi:MAG: Cof-type HAD-IIB family hydrolase [bacterium]